MRVYVDNQEAVNEFAYINTDSDVEFVQVRHKSSYVSIKGEHLDDSFEVYIDDIPKLVRALEAAYNFAQEPSKDE